jgi:hypothetical protein
VLAIWTIVVLMMTGLGRVRAVRARRVSPGAFRLGEAPDVPADVSVVNRNLMNLLEMPVLFYVVSICFYVTHHVSSGAVALAWIFVGLRLAHSWVHLTSNHILHRLTVFVVSNVVLVMLWIRLIAVLLRAPR